MPEAQWIFATITILFPLTIIAGYGIDFRFVGRKYHDQHDPSEISLVLFLLEIVAYGLCLLDTYLKDAEWYFKLFIVAGLIALLGFAIYVGKGEYKEYDQYQKYTRELGYQKPDDDQKVRDLIREIREIDDHQERRDKCNELYNLIEHMNKKYKNL